jgi:glutamine amidotransferase
MNIAIIKYNAGNIHSVRLALMRLGIEPMISDDPETLRKADKVIFPGVGEASTAMEYLKVRNLDELITGLNQPVLGICLGLQLMCRYSEENDTQCLGIFDTKVRKFPPEDKVPHMGWNTILDLESPIFDKVDDDAYVYFVHSYYAELNEYEIAKTNYILPFASAMQKNNFFAVQFHPEKSGKIGEQILKNFVEL